MPFVYLLFFGLIILNSGRQHFCLQSTLLICALISEFFAVFCANYFIFKTSFVFLTPFLTGVLPEFQYPPKSQVLFSLIPFCPRQSYSKLTAMRKVLPSLLFMLLACTLIVQAQVRKISGSVTADDTKGPLAGVTITNRSSQKTTQ